MTDAEPPAQVARFARQERLPQLGRAGQEALLRATAVVVGVGATGSVAAALLARAGVGTVRLIDRDIVEASNLPRQLLYDDDDARRGAPKAEAAAQRLARIHPELRVEAHAEDLSPRTAERLLRGATVVVDGTDGFETRLLINDWCVRAGVPWVYVGVVGVQGQSMPIVPGETACFRCYVPEAPPAGTFETCDTAGVLGTAVALIASLGATEALKLCAGKRAELRTGLVLADAWSGEVRTLAIDRDPACPCCGARDFPYLERAASEPAVALCGREAVLVRGSGPLDLAALAVRLSAIPGLEVRATPLAVRLSEGPLDATLFADGRAIVRGTHDLGRARSFVSRYLG